MSDIVKCELCGEPMPPGETMFKFHGYSGPCPKPPLPRDPPPDWESRATAAEARAERYRVALEQIHAGEQGATFSGSQCADIARAALRGEG